MVDKAEILKICKLARIDADSENLDNFIVEFNNILKHVEQLNNINTDAVLPMSHVHGIVNVYSEDLCINFEDKQSIIVNIPERSGNFIKVPIIIDQE